MLLLVRAARPGGSLLFEAKLAVSSWPSGNLSSCISIVTFHLLELIQIYHN